MANPRYKKEKINNIIKFNDFTERNLELKFGYLVYRQISLLRVSHKSNNLYSGLDVVVLKKKYRTKKSCLQANLQKVNVCNSDYVECYIPIEFNYEENGAITIKQFLK